MGKLTGKTARQEAPMSEIWNADSKGGWCFGEVASSSPLHKIWILESEARAPEAFFCWIPQPSKPMTISSKMCKDWRSNVRITTAN